MLSCRVLATVAPWVLLVPPPSRFDDRFDRRVLRRPVEQLPSQPCVGNQHGRIAGATCRGDSGNWMARDFATGVDYFADAVPAAGAEIYFGSLARLQTSNRRKGRGPQNPEMDAFANAGAAGCRIVVAKNAYRLALPQRDL